MAQHCLPPGAAVSGCQPTPQLAGVTKEHTTHTALDGATFYSHRGGQSEIDFSSGCPSIHHGQGSLSMAESGQVCRSPLLLQGKDPFSLHLEQIELWGWPGAM
jgi:hypothetical protein